MNAQLEESLFMSKCNKSPYDEIKFENILLAFVILGVGFLASVLTLIGERMTCKFCGSRKTRKLENSE
jgi:hypothetical protein